MKKAALGAVAVVFAVSFASPAGAQEPATRIVERADGRVEVVLPDGAAEVLESSVVDTLKSWLAGFPDDGMARVGGVEPAETVDLKFQHGTSQPDSAVSLANQLTYSAAASIVAQQQTATVQSLASEGLAELVEDTVADLDERAIGSPVDVPSN